ncbi:MAG: leucine-rich repeat domain-containing protein, partial [Clostridia bacterium]|nr:leucine-rich repeat domain-containing protein [Clostridia bacterium]
MYGSSDFIIENNTLSKYNGKGGAVEVPSGVTVIGAEAFENCERITEVILPAGVKRVEARAFSGCTQLQRVTLPAGLTDIGRSAFSHCIQLRQVEVPEGVTALGDYAFYGCAALIRVKLPFSLTEIGVGAFSMCTKLTDLTLPERVVTIGNHAFTACFGLADAAGMIIVRGKLYGYYGKGGHVVIPDRVWGIDGSAFARNPGLTAVTFPERLEVIGERAFAYCKGLTELVFPDRLKRIEVAAFSNCENLTRVELPEGLQHLGSNAFSFCRALTRITIPAQLGHIGERAFSGCANLTLQMEGSLSIGRLALLGVRAVVAPQYPIADFQTDEERHMAACGFLQELTRYTDPEIRVGYEIYALQHRNRLMLTVIRQDLAEALAFYDQHGRLDADRVPEYLDDAIEEQAVGCAAFLMDWQARHGIAGGTLQDEWELEDSEDVLMKRMWSWVVTGRNQCKITAYKGNALDVV